MVLYQTPALSAALLPLLTLVPYSTVHGHGYLKTPRSRNFVAAEDGKNWPLLAEDPKREYEPQSASIGGTEAQCGVIKGRNYDTPKNGVGGLMGPNPQACYGLGDTIDLEVTLTAHHKGHFEFHACPISPGEITTQDCFNANPLTFISDTNDWAVRHEEYPERAYLEPDNWETSYKFQLPDNLTNPNNNNVVGDLVLIQWHYITANSCTPEGYDTYDFPAGFDMGGVGVCGELPPDGRGTPEQFWNCAEVRIIENVEECNSSPGPITTEAPQPTTTAVATTTQAITTEEPGTTIMTTPTVMTTTTEAITPVFGTPNPNCLAATQQCGPTTTCADIGFPGMCCSKNGWCGTSPAYCGDCCQNGPCTNGPSPTLPTGPGPTSTANPPTPGFNYDATHGEDSRLIAYVGNWQACPTAEQVDAYSHIVIAFAVSYGYVFGKNDCNTECTIAPTVPICSNQNNQGLVDQWRSAGKKVILSFGGAGMGGSWAGDRNNCWDYCFGEEDDLSTSLVNIIDNQQFDGVDIDYEYCYDIDGTGGSVGKHDGRCVERDPSRYSDAKAQNFLETLTSNLRTKLDALQVSNGYNRGRYEVTHAPMDSDLTPSSSAYFQILKRRRADLDFLMPQFYNGVTRPVIDGVGGTGSGSLSAAVMFSSLANDMFDSEPNKVVFGHCIADCGGTGSNANANQALQITTDLKTYNNGEFACNGGAFFWVNLDDTGGAWSDVVVGEVSKTAGCSLGDNPFTTTTSTVVTTTEAPQTTTTIEETSTTTTTTTTEESTTTPQATTTTTTEEPATTTTAPTTEEPATTSAATTTSPLDELVINQEHRCGSSELDAREHCRSTCGHNNDCPSGMYCWGLHPNYCGSIPQRFFTNPVQSSVWTRCGTSEIDARTFCGQPCTWDGQCDGDDTCFGIHSSYCGSEFTTNDPEPTTTSAATTTAEPETTTSTTTTMTTEEPTTTTAITTTEATTTTSPFGEPVINQEHRCGSSELDAREHCRSTCGHNNDCPGGMYCWGLHPNYCGSIPQRVFTNPVQSSVWTRCGKSEIDARTFCGTPCTWSGQCSDGDTCIGLNSNYCDSTYTEV